MSRRDLLGVVAMVLVWLAAIAGARPLMLPDEGRYVGVAWEMLRSGDWLTPTLNGLPYFHKPPLFYWITAGSLSLFGMNEWAARAAPLLGAALGAVSIYLFARCWWDERAARLALLALLVQPLFFIGGQFANLDMLVAGCITATIVLLADAAMCVEWQFPWRKALAGAYAMAALGVLAKGLIGLVIPALVVGAWMVLLRRWRVLGALLWWPGALIFLLLAAPWFVAMQWRFAGFLDYFFVVQHFKRFAAGGFNNVQPFWFFPAVLLLFSLPWLPWLTRPFRHGFLSDAEREPERSPIRLLLVVWVVVVVAFFSLPRSKLLGYVLPAVPPLAMLMADGFVMALGTPPARARRLWQAGVAVAVVLSVGVVAALAIHPLRSSRDFASVLRQQRAAHEPVLMLGNYFFDLPFYARLDGPVFVVDDWSGDDTGRRDNWRKELADASRFAAPGAKAALIEPDSVAAHLCASPISWVIGPGQDSARFGLPALARPALVRNQTTLWRIDRTDAAMTQALACPALPEGATGNAASFGQPRDAVIAVHAK
jgi:4-amino-4-deoxy-L-arabinose transferase-like glycosyltransferase